MHKKLITFIFGILSFYQIAAGNQPNVVLIISDDAGYADFGFMNEVTGNTTDILTPQLDTLRSEGSLCSVAYTGAVCSPSRGAILTGSYQQRSGYFYNINNALDPADGPDGFANEETIAFERMKTAGYKTLVVGKWHVGAQADILNNTGNKVVTPGNRPPRQGVDHFFGMLSGSRDYDVPMDDHAIDSYEYRQRKLREMSPGNKSDSLINDTDEEQNSKWAGDVTDAFGQRAREYVTEHANQNYPFFLYLSFNAPHTPMYESSDYDLLNDPNHPNYANFSSMSTVRKKYCSMVYTMDKNIGLLMDRLKDPNNDGNNDDSVYDNTLIIFINDNGGSKKNESVNIPLRGDKGDPHDGGCRVPMLVTGPGISSGNIYDKPIHSMDLIPTMLAHGGSTIPSELMGVNLLERIKGNDSSNPHDYVCVAGNNGLGLRKGDWKLVIDGGSSQYLFNTSSDIGETTDLAASEPAKLDELIKDVTNFDVQMDKPRFPPKGGSHDSLNYNYSFTFAPNDVSTPSGIDKILIDYDDGDASNEQHDNAVNNGGFETNSATAGKQGKFNQIDQWINLASSGQNINALRDNNTSPNGGGWNAVLSDVNPTTKDFGIDTGHTLTAGENFTVSYAWLDGSNWVDSDKIRFQLFTTDDDTLTGTQNILHTEDSSSSSDRAYRAENFTFTAPSGVDGKTLFLRFYALSGNGDADTGFARVDNIFLGRLGSNQTETDPQFWATSNQWQDPSSASETLLETDSCSLSTLVFPAESNFDYIAQNNLTRTNGLEFIQNTLSFTGNGLDSGKTARISGNDLILAENYNDGTPPNIDLSGDGTNYTFDLALDILLYHDTVIEGDGTATYVISGEISDYDNSASLTKNGTASLTLAHDATYSGNTIINGGMLELDSGVTITSSPQVLIAANASLSGNGTISGNVVGTGTIAPGQSIGTLAIGGDAQADTLLIEVDATEADRIDVAGTLDVSGMNLEITNLATPTQNTYIIASYGNLTGTFASITGIPNDYEILYSYDNSGSSNHIVLAKINNAPVITAIPDQSDTTKDVINLATSASDSDGDSLTFSAPNLPSGLTIASSSGTISGTLADDASDASPYSVTITVTDDGDPAKSAQTSFTWSVSAFNNAPTIASISDQTNITKDIISLSVSASDSDGDTLTYSATGLPSGLSIASSTGLISGTIADDANDSSPYNVTITVNDDGDPTKSAQTSFTWSVAAFNNAPTISTISDQTDTAKDVTSLSVSASDSDGDSLTFSASNLPSGLTIASSTGLISGTLADDAADGSPYSVTITVIDDGDPAKSAQTSLTWNVAAFNNAPTITSIPDQTDTAKDVISLAVSASDSDDDTLTYSATGLPGGLSISSSTGLISGTLADDAADGSPYNVTITVTDDGDPTKSAQTSFTWNVAAFNNAPTITSISDQTDTAKDVISLAVSASDSDDDTLTYSATGLPGGLSISSSTGLISGTISDDANDSSPYSVTVTVTDDGDPAKSAQTSFTWNVAAFNNAPTITSISDQTSITKDVISLSISASDSDDDTLTYSATDLPGGLTIASSTGLISGTISDDANDSSPYSVTITVTDDGDPAKSAQTSLTWNVAAFNNAPTITSISDQTDTAKDVISLSVSASDSDDDTLTYSATGLPSGLSISSSTGLISGTLADDADTSSPYSVMITVTDDGSPNKSAQTSFTWNVAAFNNAPTINAVSDQTSITKDVISLSVSASDVDGDTLTYSATGLPNGLSISSSTGLISGTISDDANDSSPYGVTITATDDGDPAKSAQTSFTWNVSAFNNAPTITSISDQTSITKDVISLSVSASDVDSDTLTYSATGLPGGLTIASSTGLISGTISDDANDSSPYSVTITATDDGSPNKSAQTSFTWSVAAFNNAPTVTSISNQTSITKDVISLSVSASDSDDDTLTYSATNLPTGLSIASSTGLISGTISDDADDSSPYSVTITVTDDGDPAKSAQTSLTWNVAAFNNAPTITSIPDQTDTAKDVISLAVSASDSDDDNLTYSATGLPGGLSISSSTGLISGTLADDAADASPYSVTVTVIDDGSPNKSAQTSFSWHVSAFNNAPTIDAVSDQTSITKDVISLSVSASDVDSDTLTYSATGLPTGLSINSSTGLISGTISDDAYDSSPYSVTIIATDDGDPTKSAQTSLTWNVSAFNNAPTITSISDQTSITKDVISLAVSASDSDDDTLTYSATGLPSGLSIASSTGLISGILADDAADGSPYSVTITVTDDGDPSKSAQSSFTWNVAAFNNAPTIDTVSDQTSITKDVISLSISASDSDGDTLSFSATGLPGGLSISSSTGLISGTISDDADDSSPYGVTITATDDGSPNKSAQTSFTWSLAAFNNAPTVTSISDQTSITKDVISLSVSASDSDDDALTYSATNLPTGLSIASSTGLISGTISDDADDSSPYSVTITVTDDGDPAKSAQTSLTWNVAAFNNAPTITSISDQTSITKDVISLSISASDVDGDTLTYSATDLPGGLSISSSTGLISGTLADDTADGSPYSVTITVTDDGSPTKNAQTSFTWSVSAFNNTPTIDAISDQTDTAKDVISLAVSASDVDDDTLTYSATDLPAGLSISSSTGLISGTISDDANDFSPYNVTVTVIDDGSPAKNAETSLAWVVNSPPDSTAPTADLTSPAGGDNIDPAALNAQAYLEIAFTDIGDGLDTATIDGNELSLSGSGVGTAALSGGAPTLVSGTTYRYGFTGDFVNGSVNVEFVNGSFADLAGTPNLNTAETESFTVTTPPPAPTIQIIDNGDAGYTETGEWTLVQNYGRYLGYNKDWSYASSGSGQSTASWTFSGLAPGIYEVSATWFGYSNRPTNAPYTVYDAASQPGSPILVNMQSAPNADYTEGGEPFEIITASVSITSGTLVVDLSNNANGTYVNGDAIRIELVGSLGPDSTAPTADLTSPAGGDNIDPAALNAQAYLEIAFTDIGDGLDTATIDGNELSLSGSGVGTAALSGGAPTLVSGTTYRYGFTGDFVNGSVNVEFVNGSFADLAGTPNLNTAETESFTVTTPPPAPTIQIIDNGDAGYTETGEWTLVQNYGRYLGYNKDWSYASSGSGQSTASWTFSGLAPGIYEVSATWFGYSNRPTNAPYTVYDAASQPGSPILVNMQSAPNADYTEGGEPFEIITASVSITSGTLVVDLSNNANGTYVNGDAIRIELVGSLGPDSTAPTADLTSPAGGDNIDPAALNAQAYLEIAFTDIGDGLDTATIDGNELSLSGSGVGTAALSGGAPTLVSGTTYRYGFTGDFVNGSVNVEFVNGSFADLAGTPNLNTAETESFTVTTPPPAPTIQIIDNGDAGYTETGEWTLVQNYGRYLGYNKDWSYASSGSGQSTASWTFSGLAPGIYEVSATWFGYSNRPTNAPYTVYDAASQPGSPILVNMQSAPNADYTEGGEPFEIITASVSITSGTLVVDLSNNANGTYVNGDAIRIELVGSLGPDSTAPTADLTSPAGGDNIDPAALNAQAYLEIAFTDIGDGLDTATIDGNELSLSGSGVGTAALSGGAPTLVSGTTYRYGFTGDFVNGSVNVEFVNGSFADLAGTPNLNTAETESFTVTTPPPAPTIQIIDNGDAGYTETGEWTLVQNYGRYLGYNKDWSYASSGSGQSTASWTFSGLAPGIYEVSATWFGYSNRPTNAPYTVYDAASQPGSPILVNMQSAPNADYTEGGEPFEIITASVSITSGTLVVDLSNNANGTYVNGDAIRIELVGSLGPDSTAPTADLTSPAGGDNIDPAALNAQAYLEIAFTDIGDGLDTATIDGNELSLSGSGVGTAALSGGAPTLVSGTTYRYGFTGDFVNGSVNVEFVNGSFADLAGTPNLNTAETESFTVTTPPPAPTIQIIDNGDAGYTETGEWTLVQNYGRYLGYNKDWSYASSGSGQSTASWTFSGLAPGIYEVSATWFGYSNRPTNAPYTVYDAASQPGSPILVNMQSAPNADYTEGGEPFEIITASVSITSGTLVVDLSNNANGTYVNGDAIRIELVGSLGPDSTAPTADLATPAGGSTTAAIYQLTSSSLAISATDKTTTNPNKTTDPNDLFPNDANLTLISDYVDFIITYITDENAIFETDWKEPKNKSDFIAKLETVLELVLPAEQAQDPEWAALIYVEALGVVEDQLIIRTDGFHGGPLHDDWIIIEEAQDIVYEDLDTLREYLWLITR